MQINLIAKLIKPAQSVDVRLSHNFGLHSKHFLKDTARTHLVVILKTFKII